jgi:hypothetical protein
MFGRLLLRSGARVIDRALHNPARRVPHIIDPRRLRHATDRVCHDRGNVVVGQVIPELLVRQRLPARTNPAEVPVKDQPAALWLSAIEHSCRASLERGKRRVAVHAWLAKRWWAVPIIMITGLARRDPEDPFERCRQRQMQVK